MAKLSAPPAQALLSTTTLPSSAGSVVIEASAVKPVRKSRLPKALPRRAPNQSAFGKKSVNPCSSDRHTARDTRSRPWKEEGRITGGVKTPTVATRLTKTLPKTTVKPAVDTPRDLKSNPKPAPVKKLAAPKFASVMVTKKTISPAPVKPIAAKKSAPTKTTTPSSRLPIAKFPGGSRIPLRIVKEVKKVVMEEMEDLSEIPMSPDAHGMPSRIARVPYRALYNPRKRDHKPCKEYIQRGPDGKWHANAFKKHIPAAIRPRPTFPKSKLPVLASKLPVPAIVARPSASNVTEPASCETVVSRDSLSPPLSRPATPSSATSTPATSTPPSTPPSSPEKRVRVIEQPTEVRLVSYTRRGEYAERKPVASEVSGQPATSSVLRKDYHPAAKGHGRKSIFADLVVEDGDLKLAVAATLQERFVKKFKAVRNYVDQHRHAEPGLALQTTYGNRDYVLDLYHHTDVSLHDIGTPHPELPGYWKFGCLRNSLPWVDAVIHDEFLESPEAGGLAPLPDFAEQWIEKDEEDFEDLE